MFFFLIGCFYSPTHIPFKQLSPSVFIRFCVRVPENKHLEIQGLSHPGNPDQTKSCFNDHLCDQPPDCLPTQCHLPLGTTQTSAVFEHSVKTPGDAQTCGQCQRSTLFLSHVSSKAEVSSEGNLKQAKTLAETPATYVFCHCSISCGQHNNSGENTHWGYYKLVFYLAAS